MIAGYRGVFPFLAGMVLLGVAIPAQFDRIAAFYSKKTFPRAQFSTQPGDRDVVETLRLPAVLAVLKFELSQPENLPDVGSGERGQLAAILDDSRLVLDYTGAQERMAVTRGGQAIDGNLVRFDQAAFYVSGAPRPAHEIARIILHELGHVWQLRHGSVTRYLFKESLPEYLEANLPAANFSAAALERVTALLAGKAPDNDSVRFGPDEAAWEGTWEVTSHWTKPAGKSKTSATWRFTVEALGGGKCRIQAGRNEFFGTIEDGDLHWTDPGLGVHQIVHYIFWRDGDGLTGVFDGKDRAGQEIAGDYEGQRIE